MRPKIPRVLKFKILIHATEFCTAKFKILKLKLRALKFYASKFRILKFRSRNLMCLKFEILPHLEIYDPKALKFKIQIRSLQNSAKFRNLKLLEVAKFREVAV